MKTVGYLFGNILMMLIMGTVYAWSVFRVEVERVLEVGTLESGLPYMTSLFFYAFSMMVTGRFLNRSNMRKIVVAGSLLIGIGWFGSVYASNLAFLTFFYGVVIGSGVGMVYGVPVFHINHTYDEKSGLFTGIVLGGFGASPLVTAPLVSQVISVGGLQDAFMVMAVASVLVMVPLSLMFKPFPSKEDPLEEARVPFDQGLFVKVYALFLVATSIGLMMIGLTYRIGVVDYGFETGAVSFAMALFAVLNGLARPVFGHLMDRIGFIKSATLSTALIVLGALLAFLNHGESVLLYGLSFGLFWFNLGAWLAIVPAAIKEYFGKAGYARRYGTAFTAYGLGAIVGTLLSGVLLDWLSDTRYVYALILVFTMMMIGFLKAFIVNQKRLKV
ncbi:MAG: MFS transporter [Bacillota bacterium]